MQHPELKHIYEEIVDIRDESDDLQMLEALANNAIYVLSKIQQSNNVADKATASVVLTDMLNTLNKEFLWAKEEQDLLEKHRWFVKAKKQFLEDMQALF
jgi:hypothetical protein